MEKISWNRGWTVWPMDDETAPQAVVLPHDAMLGEERNAASAGGMNTGWFVGHDYIYEKRFMAPTAWMGKCVALEFEGVYRQARVFLNGKQIAHSLNGYLPFRVMLDNGLLLGEVNIIRVEVKNADQPNSRWYSGAGIYRPVWLVVLPAAHLETDGVKISTIDYRTRQIKVHLSANVAGTANVEILDGKNVLARQTLSVAPFAETIFSLNDAELWSPKHPKQYTCSVTFGEDTRKLRFGIRTIECNAQIGFCLNGERVILRGACVHHDNGLLGAITEPFAERRKVRLLLDAGYNAIRSAHNPCSVALLEACDDLGMLVMDEYADMWYIHKTLYDYAEHVMDNWKMDLKTLSDRDFNHPSVIMYSIGNEVSETAQRKGIELASDMCQYLHELDYRPVTCGVNIFFNYLSALGFGVYSDKNAQKEAIQAKRRKEKPGKRAVGSEFFNNLAGLMGSEFMKFGATLHGSDLKTRGVFAVLDVAGYNYGIKRYKKDLKKYPNRVILGSETFCSDVYKFWDLAKNNPALIGDFVWAGIDYLGEVGLGAWEYKDYAPDFGRGPGWLTSGSGRLDITGRFLGEAYYTRIALGQMTGPEIAVCPVNHTHDKHSPSAWKMSNALPSWSWEGCAGRPANVEVYARAAAVELKVNGKMVGKKKPKNDCMVRFKVVYEDGIIEAIAYDDAGRRVGHCALHTAERQTVLKAVPEQPVAQAGSLSYIRLRYCDKNGEIKPLARGTLKVEVTGAKLIGLGSACPYHERSYLSNETDTYFGEALAIVRVEDGPFSLKVSDGTWTDRVTVQVE